MRKAVFILMLLLCFGQSKAEAQELRRGGYEDNAPKAFNGLNRPKAIYDSAVNKTFLAYQNESFDLYVVEYNHSTCKWSYPLLAINSPLSADTHGSPSINIDSQGYLHIFGASHITALKHYRSDSIKDISAWTAQTNLGTLTTYPFTDYFLNKLWLFYREGTTANSDWVYSNEDDFTSLTTLLDNGANSSYLGGIYNDGTYLYTAWTWQAGGSRSNPSFAKFDGTNWYKADGTQYVLPVTQVNADLILNTGANACNVFDVKADANGVIYVLITLSDSASHIDDGDFKCAVWAGGVWTTYNIAEINNTFDVGSFDVINTTTVDAYLTVDGLDDGTEKTRGGIVKKYRSTNNGQTWTLQETISKTTEQSNAVYIIHSYNTDLKAVWTYGNNAPSFVEGFPTDVEVPFNAQLNNCILQGVTFGQ